MANYQKMQEQELFKEKWKKYKRDKNEKVHTSYFKGHICQLPQETSSNTSPGDEKPGALMQWRLYLTAANYGDIRTREIYRSYAALQAEIQRHFTYYPLSIHPFSRLRLAMDILSFISLFVAFTIHGLWISDVPGNIVCTVITTSFEALFLLNVIINFFTGYVAGITSPHVVLDLRKIVFRYARTWLLIDILFCAGLPCFREPDADLDWHSILTIFKILKLPTLFTYVNNIMKVMDAGNIIKTIVEITLLVYNYIVWNVHFQLFVEYSMEGTFYPETPRACSWITINHLWNATPTVTLIYASHRAVNMLRQNANFKLFEEGVCSDTFFIVAWIIAKLVVFHCTLKYTLLLFGLESARAKYFIMSQQVENYMKQRKFPSRIKRKILKFYAVRFQSQFFVESRMMSCVSGQLGEDIIMYSGRQLVSQVEFLKQLPRSLLLRIGTKLKLEVFLAGDIIFKINTVGDCLYFIDKGTVAIYSESGKEICHLEDGSFFGEIALIMNPAFRPASAVAVTNCELYRLDKKDFDSTIACFPTVYEDIKKVAAQRLERTIVIDEHHKAELSMGKDHKDDTSNS